MEFNTKFNTEEIVLENFYDAMVHLAFKFDAVVTARFDTRIDTSIVKKVMNNVVYHFSWRVTRTLAKQKGIQIRYIMH